MKLREPSQAGQGHLRSCLDLGGNDLATRIDNAIHFRTRASLPCIFKIYYFLGSFLCQVGKPTLV